MRAFWLSEELFSRSQWPRGLRRRSAAARLLRSWVRNPRAAWMFVCCRCCVLSGRGLCDELITRPEESYRLWCVVVCDLETSRMRRPWPALGRSATEKEKGHYLASEKLCSMDMVRIDSSQNDFSWCSAESSMTSRRPTNWQKFRNRCNSGHR
jgi:hypothetical protein